MYFEQAFKQVVGIEGAFGNHPDDSGGNTKFGITEQLARAYDYIGDMRDMPLAVAKVIYRRHFWDNLKLDDIAKLSLPIALELFDTAVNTGLAVAGTFLQRSLNVFNRKQSDYPDIKVDGLIGAITISTLKTYLTRRGAPGERVMLRALNSLQGAFYIELSERREKDESFTFGWILNRVAVAGD